MTLRNIRVLALTALAFPGVLPAQDPPRRGDDPGGAQRYLHELRAFTNGQLPVRARQNALAQMRARWPQAFLRRDANLSSVPNIPSTTTWQPIGPLQIQAGSQTNSGRLNSIAIHPTDPNIIYVGGAQGGVWRTVNGGTSWVPLTDSQCSLAMGSVVLDPVNPQIVYAGTGEQNNSLDSYYGCGVLRSTDGGQTWQELGKAVFDLVTGGRRISRVVVDKATAGSTSTTIVFAATDNGLYRSTNSGVTWTATSDVAGVVSDIVADDANAGVFYAAVGRYQGSGNGSDNGVYKTTNSGASWTKVSKAPVPTAGVGRINLAISVSAPLTVYAAIHNPTTHQLLGIAVTTDGGTTWTFANPTPTTMCNAQCWYNQVIAVDPSDPNTVYFGGLSLFKSTNGGTSFTDIGQTIHVDHHGFAFHPGTPGTIYSGNDGGIFKSTTAGLSWTSLNTNLELTQFYSGISVSPTSATTILGGTQDNGTLEWSGVGQWPERLGGDGGYTAIDQLTGTTAFAETQWSTPASSNPGGPRRRDPGGAQFIRRDAGINRGDRAIFIPPLVMDPARPRIAYFGTLHLYRTANFGETWTVIGTNLGGPSTNINAIGVAASDSLTVYVGSTDGRVQYTHDGGTIWSPASIPSAVVPTDFAVDPRDARTAIAVFAGFSETNKVWRTTDGGTTWENLTLDLPNIPVLAVVLEPGSRDITIGTDLGVFTLRNGTSSWAPVVNGLPNVAVFDLAYDAPRSRLIAATHGRGMFSLDVALTALRGDVNNNGSIDAADAQIILAAVVGNAVPSGTVRFPNGDANCDGQVTALDAMIVLRKVAGITDAGVCVGTVK